MADSYVQVPPDSTGKKVDAGSLDVGAISVLRQRIVIADNSASAGFATVSSGALHVALQNAVALSGTAMVAGRVDVSSMPAMSLAADQVLGSISRTVQVAVATPFTVNNISATVAVAGNVNISTMPALSLAADQVLGSISRTVQVAIGTPFTLNNVSATVVVAGNVNLSGTASIAGRVDVSSMPAMTLAADQVLGSISRTVQVAIGTPFTLNNVSATVSVVVAGRTPTLMSASHGPRCVTVSTSAAVTLVPSPGAGASVHITQLMVGNYGSAITRARIGTSASASTIVQPLAANGGGFVLNFDPPWKLSASEAAVLSVKPNVSEVYVTVNYYVEP